MHYVIEYDKNGPFMRQYSPGDYTWAEAVARLNVLRREWAAKILGSGDGISTKWFASIWGCDAPKVRGRLRKMPGMIATQTEGTGRIGGRYADDVWQLASYEEAGALERALDAIFSVQT